MTDDLYLVKVQTENLEVTRNIGGKEGIYMFELDFEMLRQNYVECMSLGLLGSACL